MKDKEKQIEEMTDEKIIEILKKRIDNINPWETHALEYHKGLLNLINRLKAESKLPKDSVVLSREEYGSKLQDAYDNGVEFGKEWGSKETAEKILNELHMHFSADKLCGIANPNKNYNSAKVVSRLAKQFGVEIKE